MAGKKSSKPASAGVGEAQPKAKAKTAFPRSKTSEIQEALNHLTYFKELLTAQEFALKRLDTNRQICTKNIHVWTARIEKMQEMM